MKVNRHMLGGTGQTDFGKLATQSGNKRKSNADEDFDVGGVNVKKFKRRAEFLNCSSNFKVAGSASINHGHLANDEKFVRNPNGIFEII